MAGEMECKERLGSCYLYWLLIHPEGCPSSGAAGCATAELHRHVSPTDLTAASSSQESKWMSVLDVPCHLGCRQRLCQVLQHGLCAPRHLRCTQTFEVHPALRVQPAPGGYNWGWIQRQPVTVIQCNTRESRWGDVSNLFSSCNMQTV